MNDLKIFSNETFGSIRTIEENGKIMFCGTDVARALGYAGNPQDAIRRHCWDDGCANHAVIDNLGRIQQARFIGEGNLYRLITHSKLPAAVQFEKWVFDEVIPTLRRTGTYEMTQKPLSPLEQMKLQGQALLEVDAKVELVDRDLQQFKQDMPILGIEESRITAAVRKKGVRCLGGEESNAYHDKSLRGKVYADIYGQLKREYGVDTYKAIKRSQCDVAVGIIDGYELPLVLVDEIADLNNQLEFDDLLN